MTKLSVAETRARRYRAGAFVLFVLLLVSDGLLYLAVQPSELDEVRAYGKAYCAELGTSEYEIAAGFVGDEMTQARGRCGAEAQPGLQANNAEFDR